MEIADLKTLVAVVNHSSITRAAEDLHRVPSGVTTRILQLEESLGVQLFLREKKRLQVTPKGRELYEYATKIIDLLDEAERRMTCATPGGKFHIGASDGTLASRLSVPLARLNKKYPEINLEITTGTGGHLWGLLLENSLDAAFVSDPPLDDRIKAKPVFEEELVFIAPAKHKPIRKPADLEVSTVLAFKEGCTYRQHLMDWFNEHNSEPERIAELPSDYAIYGGAAAGMGVGMVPKSVMKLFPKTEAISIHPLRHPLAKSVTVLAWRKEMESANLSALMDCLPRSFG